MNAAATTLFRYSPLLLIAIAWEGASRLGLVSSLVLPSLSSVITAWIELIQSGELVTNGAASLWRAGAGLFLAVMIGAALGIVMAWWKPVNVLLSPLVEMFYPMPKSALIPVTLLWLGFGKTYPMGGIESKRIAGLQRAALKKLAPTAGERRAKAKTGREQEYLDAVEILYGEGSKPDRDSLYARAMEGLHERHPEDVDAAAPPDRLGDEALGVGGAAHVADGRVHAAAERLDLAGQALEAFPADANFLQAFLVLVARAAGRDVGGDDVGARAGERERDGAAHPAHAAAPGDQDDLAVEFAHGTSPLTRSAATPAWTWRRRR